MECPILKNEQSKSLGAASTGTLAYAGDAELRASAMVGEKSIVVLTSNSAKLYSHNAPKDVKDLLFVFFR